MHHDNHRYRYLLAFGSNLGERRANCQRALQTLSQHALIIKVSSWISTPPLPSTLYPVAGQGDYLNFIADVSSNDEPAALYERIRHLEDEIGHSRLGKWQPRHIDIDILFWALNTSLEFAACQPRSYSDDQGLQIPHTGFWQRDFLINLASSDLRIPLAALEQHG